MGIFIKKAIIERIHHIFRASKEWGVVHSSSIFGRDNVSLEK